MFKSQLPYSMLRFAGYFSVIGKSDVRTEVRRLLLSYMNGIQAVYILPSLREEIDISIVRYELFHRLLVRINNAGLRCGQTTHTKTTKVTESRS
jgi:hypothetical protein